MGRWTLQSVTGTTSNYDTSELFGTNVVVTFTLVYRPARFGRFSETPKLDWHERFVMKEYGNNEWWEFEANMYAHNPTSNTLKIWPGRYIAAYGHATGQPADPFLKGSVQLLTVLGQPLPPNAIAKGIRDKKGQAEAVRNYLKKSGGTLVIEIHDIPSIHRPAHGEHKERMLVFDCGIVGGGQRFTGVQHLDLDGSAHHSTWVRSFQSVEPATFSTTGFNQVAPPEGVSRVRSAIFMPGEYA